MRLSTLVLLSSARMQDGADGWRAKGFAAALVKPVRRANLLTTLLEVVGESRKRRSDAAPSHTGGKQHLGLHVLVVEDNVVNQTVATRMLERWGCRVDVVGDGRQAIEAVARVTYDVVLMDVQMPEMDGFDATVAIRQQEAGTGRRVPIVAMTAHAMDGDRDRCLEAGMDDYLPKPVTSQALLQAVSRWGGRGATPRQATQPPVPTPAS